MSRHHSAAVYNGLKTAFKLLVERLGGIDAAASCTRVGRSKIAEYGNVAQPERFPPADVIADLEHVAGAPLVTAALARVTGHELIPVETSAPGVLAQRMAELGRDVAQTFADASEVLAGAEIDAGHREKLLTDLAEISRAVAGARAALPPARTAKP